MKILLLAPQPFFQIRGTPIATKLLLNTLGRRGHEIDLLTLHEGEDVDIPNCTIHRIPRVPGVHGVPPGFSMKKVICDVVMLVTACRMCSRERWDVVHAVEESVFIAWILHKLWRIPYVYDMDSSLPDQLKHSAPWLRPVIGIARRLETLAIRGSIGVITVCKELEALAKRRAESPVVVRVEDASLLPAVIDDEQQLLRELDGPIVMYVGNLQEYQGIDLLLQSFELLLGSHPDARLVIFGGSAKKIAYYRRRAARQHVDARIHFLGLCPLSELMGYLRRADVLVSPRLSGGNTPMKIYSYLDSGTPLVATRLPTHTQVLNEQLACLVMPTANAIANGIDAVLRNPREAAAMGERARQWVRAHHRPETASETIISFYAEIQHKLHQPPTTPQEAVLAR